MGAVGWAGRTARPRGLAATAADQEVRRPRPQAATGDRPGTPGADGLGLPGSPESGITPHAPSRVCVFPEKVFASLPQVERGVSKILGGDPKGDNFLYTNGKCVILRNIDVSTPCPRGACFRPCPASYLHRREFLPFRPLISQRVGLGSGGATPLLPRSHTLETQITRLDCFVHPQPPLTLKLRLGSVWLRRARALSLLVLDHGWLVIGPL